MDLAKTTAIAEALCISKGWSPPEYIDHGNSAAVFRVVHPTFGDTALKVYDPSFFEGGNALIEAKRIELQAELKAHGNPNLIEILEIGELPSDGTWFLLMEFCPWKSLEKRLTDVPNEKIHRLIKQLVNAVLFLESRGLVHRDIKPANIVVSADFEELKLLDLGVLRKIAPEEGSGTDGDEKKRFIATAQYSPPEYLTREELPGHDGFAAINLYQVGAVLHDLLMKVAIFAAEAATQNKYILYKAVTTKKPRVANHEVPPRIVGLCIASLDKNPANRIQSVSLDAFLADADLPEDLRKRLGGKKAPSDQVAAPSLLLWRKRVRSLVAAAARRERETLGSFTMPAVDTAVSTRWTLRFTNTSNLVHVDLVAGESKLDVRVVADTVPPVISTIAEIGVDGSDLEDAEFVEMIAVNILYSLDLASSDGHAENHDLNEPGDE